MNVSEVILILVDKLIEEHDLNNQIKSDQAKEETTTSNT